MFNQETRILVVDDMMTMRKLIRRCLADLELREVTEANDGEAAWSQLEESIVTGMPYQLVITDWNMPKMHGIDLLRRIRAHQSLRDTPVILITAESEQEHVTQAVEAGVSAYIVKPFSSSTFAEGIKKVAGGDRG